MHGCGCGRVGQPESAAQRTGCLESTGLRAPRLPARAPLLVIYVALPDVFVWVFRLDLPPPRLCTISVPGVCAHPLRYLASWWFSAAYSYEL